MYRIKKLGLIVLMVISIFLGACSKPDFSSLSFRQSENFKTLGFVNYPSQELNIKTVDEKAIEAINAFAAKTVEELFSSKENYIYSPLSLYVALGMLAEGVSSETALDQIENLLGSNLTAIRKEMPLIYNNNYYTNKKGSLRLANSIWIKDGLDVLDQYLESLATSYYAESYQTKFDLEGKKNIIAWINHYTNNLLNLTLENYEINSNNALMILNTIYFDNQWRYEFKESDTANRIFYAEDEEVNVPFISHELNSKFHEEEDYFLFEDYFTNQTSITYLLTKDENKICDFLNLNVLEKALNFQGISTDVKITVPKFKYFSAFNLNESLKDLGIIDIFDKDKSTLEKISPDFGSNRLYVSSIRQNAGIEFSENGVKAAAVTSVDVESTSLPPSKLIELLLNRPFLYIIKDSLGIPLFIGLMNNPKL